jgi:hypothetical protein
MLRLVNLLLSNRNNIVLAAHSLQPIKLSLPTPLIEGATHIETYNKTHKTRCHARDNVKTCHDNPQCQT